MDTLADCSEQLVPRTANAQHTSPWDRTLVHRGTVVNPVPSPVARQWAMAHVECSDAAKGCNRYGLQEEQEQAQQAAEQELLTWCRCD